MTSYRHRGFILLKLAVMSIERDELIRLVQTIPDEQVSRMLAEVREVAAVTSRGGASGWYRDMIEEPSYWT